LNDVKSKLADKPIEDLEEPEIRFGEAWIPAHQAWKKMEIASTTADFIERFNQKYPHLSCELTRSVVPEVRHRLKNVEVRTGQPKQQPDIVKVAGELLLTLSPEEVVDRIEAEFGEAMTLNELIALAGEESYQQAMQREAHDFAANRISADQTAQVWNEMGRPAPGGGLWSKAKVEYVMNTEF